MSFGTYSCQEVSGYRSPWVCYPDSSLLNMQAEQSEPEKPALLNMEGCKAPGAPCNTETNDINCCYAFGTYKCMGETGKQKCTYAPSSLLNMSDDISGEDSSSDDDVKKVTGGNSYASALANAKTSTD